MFQQSFTSRTIYPLSLPIIISHEGLKGFHRRNFAVPQSSFNCLYQGLPIPLQGVSSAKNYECPKIWLTRVTKQFDNFDSYYNYCKLIATTGVIRGEPDISPAALNCSKAIIEGNAYAFAVT